MKILRYIILCTAFIALLAFSSCEQECRHDNMTESKKDPTCTENGQTTYSCSNCGYTYVADIIEPIGHKFESEIISPTCTKDGYTQYTCDCGQTYISDYASATGHTYVDTVNDATCTESGYTEHLCSVCSHSYTSSYTEPKGHDFDDGYGLAPTCTEYGYTCYICSDCRFSYNTKYTEPLEHQYSTVITPPTCIDKGFTSYACDNCSFTYKSDYTEPLGHKYTREILAEANCTEKGEEKYTCVCGDTYSIITSPLGHDFDRIVTMPTISDMGYTEFTCKNDSCGYKYTGDYRFYSDILENAYAVNTDVLAKGIDISYHNYKSDANGYISLDWNAIKAAGVSYVIIRIADPAIGIDPTFEKSYQEAKAAGLDVGFYFYTRATSVEEIRREAYLVQSALEGKQFEYPVYLDLEDEALINIDKAILNEMCIEFFTILQRAGYYTGLYVNHEWLNNVIDKESALSRFEIWYARYSTLADGEEYRWNVEENGEHLGMWQYTDSGIIEGIDTKFDFNFCYKDYPTLIKNGGFNGYDTDANFPDTGKSFIWVVYDGTIKIRSKSDYFTTDEYDSTLDVIGYASHGSRFEVIEQNEKYTAILYNGQTAYISANPTYVSFKGIYFTE